MDFLHPINNPESLEARLLLIQSGAGLLIRHMPAGVPSERLAAANVFATAALTLLDLVLVTLDQN